MFNENKEFEFYGVYNNEFKLNDTVYEALEDPSDGYRSYLSSITVKNSNGIFFRTPLTKVRAVANDLDGWDFVDVVDGHVWLSIGTSYQDQWYPTFVFHYEPKTSYC
jgi:hypothetical protein